MKFAKKLREYVKRNDLESIDHCLQKKPNLINFEYPDCGNQKILTVAFTEKNVSSETIKKLIERGSDIREIDKVLHWQPIHYATLYANYENLKVMLEHLTVDEANSLVNCPHHLTTKFSFCPNKNVKKSYSNNVLSILLKYGRRSEQFHRCCQLLIQKGVNVNHADSNGITPLDLLKEEELSDIRFEVDSNEELSKVQKLFKMVKYDKIEEFLAENFSEEEANGMDASNEFFSSCTLLQMCCLKNLTSCVEHILKEKGDINKTIQKNINCPIMIAIKQDHEKLVNLLLENSKIDLPEDVLIRLQTKFKHMKNISAVDNYIELILQFLSKKRKSNLKKYIYVTDELQRTPLHYAVLYRTSGVILKLLELGAPLTKKDIFGETPLAFIDPKILEKFLDDCVALPKSAEDMNSMIFELQNQKQKFVVEVNYETFVSDNLKDEFHESDFLRYLIKIKKITHLLNHPVISSYLEVKWSHYRWTIFLNLFCYIIAYFSSFFYVFAYEKYPFTSNVLLLVSIIFLIIREDIQLSIFRWHYILRVENIISLLLIGSSIYVVAANWFQDLNNHNHTAALSIVFLAATLSIFLQLQNIPFFMTKVLLLKQIALNFCKHMLFYLFPLLAFFISFYMLNAAKDNAFFTTLYDILTMFAGDPNSDYPEQFPTNPVFSRIIYVCFIVLIGIILQNLLMGLAVNDLQAIQKEAEFMNIKERADYITHLEKIVFSKYRQTSNWLLKKIYKKLLYSGSVFGNDKILQIQPYNEGCTFVKDFPNKKVYIKDESLTTALQNIFKKLAIDQQKKSEEKRSLEDIYCKLKGIEERLSLEEIYCKLKRIEKRLPLEEMNCKLNRIEERCSREELNCRLEKIEKILENLESKFS